VLQQNLLTDIVLIIAIATLLAYLARILRQPLIAAYVLAGIIIGPLGLSLATNISAIRAISDIGIILLLFIVGLQINITGLKSVGLAATLGGALQVALTFIFGFTATKLAGFSNINATYAGLIVAFSSTIIVVKLLSDRDELNSLHGRIIVGILLVQDVLVIFPLSFLALHEFAFTPVLAIVGKILLLLAIAYLARKVIIGRLFHHAAKSTELLFLMSISFCFLFAVLAYYLGLSIAIGAFLGGVTLASLPYYLNIIGEIKPLKDFFATIFFVSLGMQVSTLTFDTAKAPLIILLLLTLAIKPLIIMVLLSLFGYSKRTSFITAISLAQISEFSLILVTQAKGIISEELFSLTIIVAAISITLTAYLIKYYEQIYKALSTPLSLFEKLPSNKKELIERKTRDHHQIICFGCHRMGSIITEELKKLKKRFLVIDLNPDIIKKLKKKGIDCVYGDISNTEILRLINAKHTQLVISTVPNEEENIILLRHTKQMNPKILVFLTANHLNQALNLYARGADYVIVPHITCGERVSSMLDKVLPNRGMLKEIRNRHLKMLLSLDSRYK